MSTVSLEIDHGRPTTGPANRILRSAILATDDSIGSHGYVALVMGARWKAEKGDIACFSGSEALEMLSQYRLTADSGHRRLLTGPRRDVR